MELTTVIHRLVCHTNLKNAGKFRNASRRSLKVSGSGFVFFGGRVFNIFSFCLIRTNVLFLFVILSAAKNLLALPYDPCIFALHIEEDSSLRSE